MSGQTSKLRMVLATEQILFREAMRSVVEGVPDLEMVGEAADGSQAVKECERTQPDVLILDGYLRNWDAARTTAMVKDRVPDCRVLILSNSDDQSTLLDALEAGASGYVSKHSELDDLIGALREIHAGQTLIPPRVLGPLLSKMINSKKQREEAILKMVRLTQREREVLAILAEGGDNTIIAARLVISPRTAKTHIQSVLSKLGLHSRLEAAAFVRRYGLRTDLLRANNE
jgi:DNA-binding NarL/FixJ family response regulator